MFFFVKSAFFSCFQFRDSFLGMVVGKGQFSSSSLGSVTEISREKLSPGCNDVLCFTVSSDTKCRRTNVVMWGWSSGALADVERGFVRALTVLKSVSEAKTVSPTRGATETALSVYLEKVAYQPV
jgi:hypothetical protein